MANKKMMFVVDMETRQPVWGNVSEELVKVSKESKDGIVQAYKDGEKWRPCTVDMIEYISKNVSKVREVMVVEADVMNDPLLSLAKRLDTAIKLVDEIERDLGTATVEMPKANFMFMMNALQRIKNVLK